MKPETSYELIQLISYIQEQHRVFSEQWRARTAVSYNLKRLNMCDIPSTEGFLQHIRNYLEFCSDFAPVFDLSAPVIHRSRVKQLNSVQMKIDKYSRSAEGGKSPVTKGLNDLFGVRYICREEVSFTDINSLIDQTGYKLKCLDASKREGYIATHIYFHIDNTTFDWELQVWNQKDAPHNIELHTRYKQDYKFWEKEQKGGSIT